MGAVGLKLAASTDIIFLMPWQFAEAGTRERKDAKMVLEMNDPDRGNREYYISSPTGRLAGPYETAGDAMSDMNYFRSERRFPRRMRLISCPRGVNLMVNGQPNLFHEVDEVCK